MVALAYIMLNFVYLFQYIPDPNEPGRVMTMDALHNEVMEYLAIGLIGLMCALNFAVMIKLSLHKAILVCRKRKM